MGKDLTEVRSPQRPLIPVAEDWEHYELPSALASCVALPPASMQSSLRGIANKVKWKPYLLVSYGFIDCESEYDRGAGCGKTARPDLYGGRQATGVPTMTTGPATAGETERM